MPNTKLYLCSGFFGLLICLCLGGASCRERSAPSSKRTTPSLGEVIARVGTLSILRSEFEHRFTKERQKGQTPRQFLQRLIEEKLLWQEAQRLKLDKQTRVRLAWRKAMVRQLMHADFERWFRPESIDLLTLRKEYRNSADRYNRPKQLKVVHLLSPLPYFGSRLPKNMSPAERAQWPTAKLSSRILAEEALSLFKKEQPKDVKSFSRIARQLVEKYNKPVALLFRHRFELQKKLEALRGQPLSRWVPALVRASTSIEKQVFCTPCDAFVARLSAWKGRFQSSSRLFTPKLIKKLLTDLARVSSNKEIRLKFEVLTPFPERHTPNWPNVVERFSTAAAALKDKEFSQDVVETSFGYHIIFREHSIPGKSVPFAKVRREISELLYRKKRPLMFRRWLEKLGSRFTTRIYYERLKRVKKRL